MQRVHNDDSAIALQVFGWIFSIPWLIAVAMLVGKICHEAHTPSAVAHADV